MGKCRQTNAAQYEITHEHVSKDLKMFVKRLHTEIHNMITVYIHNRAIYFRIITCIILGLVISNDFACKNNSVFSDFVDSGCNWQAQLHGGARFVKTGEFSAKYINASKFSDYFLLSQVNVKHLK